MTSLSVMSIVNMCKISEEIKSIFIQKNGVQIITDLLSSKDEGMLMNGLRLLMTNLDNISEDNHHKIISRLMDLIKIGPNISYCSFSDQVNFMSFSLLRAFIQFNSNNKSQIMNDKEKDEGIKIPSIMDMMLEMLRPDKIDSLRYDIEDTILALLI